MKREAELEGYFAEAASWDADRVATAKRLARLSLGVAGAGWLAVLLLSGALIPLMPLKRVEPFVIRVDNTTGVVDVVPVYTGKSAMPETVTRYLLDSLRDGLRALQLRDRRERLRGVRRLS